MEYKCLNAGLRARALLASAQGCIAADHSARSVAALQTCIARDKLPAVNSRSAYAPPSRGNRAAHAAPPSLPSGHTEPGTCTLAVRDHRVCARPNAITATQPRTIRRCFSSVHSAHVHLSASGATRPSELVHRCNYSTLHPSPAEHWRGTCHHASHEGECSHHHHTHHQREGGDDNGTATPGQRRQGQGKPSRRVCTLRKAVFEVGAKRYVFRGASKLLSKLAKCTEMVVG